MRAGLHSSIFYFGYQNLFMPVPDGWVQRLAFWHPIAGRIINDDPRTFIERVKILAGPRLATISVEIDTLSPQRVDPPVPALGIPY